MQRRAPSQLAPALAALFGLWGFAGCADPGSSAGASGDVSEDAEAPLGKRDAWDWANRPGRAGIEMAYNIDELPASGQAPSRPWAASYWPYYQGGISARWQPERGLGAETNYRGLSPAEKYDVAFHDWRPSAASEAEPYDLYTCSWDQAYYDAFGPTAAWTHTTRGLGRATNGTDDDRDGVADAEECAQNDEQRSYDFDGIELWWGICHAWAPAAIMEPEPLAPVTRRGVTFDVSDQKALIIQQWDRASYTTIGSRCSDAELERGADGRVSSDQCRDMNAGSWHVTVTNMLGRHSRPFVIERTANYEVWNQPLFGYEITEQTEISLERAHELLGAGHASPGDGDYVLGIEEGSGRARALLAYLEVAHEDDLRDAIGLEASVARAIVAARDGADLTPRTDDDAPFGTVAELAAVVTSQSGDLVTREAAAAIADFALENGYGPRVYAFNPDAVRFVEVRMRTDWMTESHPSAERTDLDADAYVRHDRYHYVLELDVDGAILGGEWLGSSRETHPDFVWVPTGTRGGNPHIDIDEVRSIILEGRQSVLGDDDPWRGETSAQSTEPETEPEPEGDGPR